MYTRHSQILSVVGFLVLLKTEVHYNYRIELNFKFYKSVKMFFSSSLSLSLSISFKLREREEQREIGFYKELGIIMSR